MAAWFLHCVQTMSRTQISYGRDDETGEERCAIVKAEPYSGDVALIHLTNAEIDRIVAAREQYHRETKHRGYPVRG